MLRNVFRRAHHTISGLSANLSVQGKSTDATGIHLKCMDLIKHPSADQAIFNLDELDSWVRQRSDAELDIFAAGEQERYYFLVKRRLSSLFLCPKSRMFTVTFLSIQRLTSKPKTGQRRSRTWKHLPSKSAQKAATLF